MTSVSNAAAPEYDNTHHIRLKCAAEMFHTLVTRHEPSVAANITCELLQIKPMALRHALQNDHLADLKRAYRDLTILKKRAAGFAPKEIATQYGLSRVQIWRVIREIETDLETVKALGKRKIRGKIRLNYQELAEKTGQQDLKPAF